MSNATCFDSLCQYSRSHWLLIQDGPIRVNYYLHSNRQQWVKSTGQVSVKVSSSDVAVTTEPEISPMLKIKSRLELIMEQLLGKGKSSHCSQESPGDEVESHEEKVDKEIYQLQKRENTVYWYQWCTKQVQCCGLLNWTRTTRRMPHEHVTQNGLVPSTYSFLHHVNATTMISVNMCEV